VALGRIGAPVGYRADPAGKTGRAASRGEGVEEALEQVLLGAQVRSVLEPGFVRLGTGPFDRLLHRRGVAVTGGRASIDGNSGRSISNKSITVAVSEAIKSSAIPKNA